MSNLVGDNETKELSKTALKKKLKQEQEEMRKLAKKEAKALLNEENENNKVEEVNDVLIKLDLSLPKPIQIKIRDSHLNVEKRVKIYGFVHFLRTQGFFF